MLTRRKFLLQSAMTAAIARSSLSQQPANGSAGPVCEIAQGRIRGDVTDGVGVFRGVPFAQPPVGGLRFRPPRPALPWTGVRDATHFAAAATQPNLEDFPQSEDCLYLNLWAPQAPGPFPVFVWVHGGGFTGGRPSEPLYDGTRFAQAGIVCITVAYRLGVFGFLDMSPLFGPAYTGSADNALLDLIAALQWVQANVAAFGGDPHRVTLGGESAGAKLTDILMGIPQAQPLFHQMISESGGAERIWPEARATQIAAGFADVWARSSGLTVPELLAAGAAPILAAQQLFTRTYPQHFPLRPELNGTLCPLPPLTAIRNGSTRNKRLLLGTNRDESAFFLGPNPKKAIVAGDLGNLGVQQFQPIMERYRALYPQDSYEYLRIRAVTAEEYWVPSLRVADAHTMAGGEAYMYRLDLPGKGRFAGLAFHSYDLRFVWDRFGQEQPSAAEQKLAAAMHNAWVAFIHGREPADPDLPAWPRYSLERRPTMILDQVSHVELAPNAAELKLWDGLLMN